MIEIPEVILKQILLCAEKHYPNECCGILIGTSGSIREIRETENVASELRHRRYAISPLDLFEADNYARSLGMDIIGIYHSHPDHPPNPSEFDRKHVLLHYLYLIVNVTEGRAGAAACWTLPSRNSEFTAEELTVVKSKLG
jgi:proteasome lid subunit RPN8/RPN11